MRKIILGVSLLLGAFSIQGCVKDVDVYEPVPAPIVYNTAYVKVLWKTSISSGVGHLYSQLQPTYDENRVYAASRNGMVYALDKKDGDKIWGTDLDDEDENDDRRSARLSGGVVVDGDKLFVCSENGYVYALNAENGDLLWKYDMGQEIISAPAVGYDKVFVLSATGQVVALDIETGEKVWITGFDNGMLSLRGDSSPVVLDRSTIVYGGIDGKISFINTDTGLLLQQTQVGIQKGATRLERLNDVVSTPLKISKELYAVAFKGYLKGMILTSPDANNITLNYNSYRDMAYDYTDIALTNNSGHVYAIMRSDGSQRWVNTALTYRNTTAPAFLDKFVVVGDYEGYLYLMDNATGEFKAMIELDSSGLYTGAVVDEDVAYIQARDGTLYAFKASEDKIEE